MSVKNKYNENNNENENEKSLTNSEILSKISNLKNYLNSLVVKMESNIPFLGDLIPIKDKLKEIHNELEIVYIETTNVENKKIAKLIEKKMQKLKSQDKNEFILISGLAGSGKSLLSIALVLKQWNIKEFNFDQMLINPKLIDLQDYDGDSLIVEIPKYRFCGDYGKDFTQCLNIALVRSRIIYLTAINAVSLPSLIHFELSKEYKAIRVLDTGKYLKIIFDQTEILHIDKYTARFVTENNKEIFIPKFIVKQFKEFYKEKMDLLY